MVGEVAVLCSFLPIYMRNALKRSLFMRKRVNESEAAIMRRGRSRSRETLAIVISSTLTHGLLLLPSPSKLSCDVHSKETSSRRSQVFAQCIGVLSAGFPAPCPNKTPLVVYSVCIAPPGLNRFFGQRSVLQNSETIRKRKWLPYACTSTNVTCNEDNK